jgi:hypothetical protein
MTRISSFRQEHAAQCCASRIDTTSTDMTVLFVLLLARQRSGGATSSGLTCICKTNTRSGFARLLIRGQLARVALGIIFGAAGLVILWIEAFWR